MGAGRTDAAHDEDEQEGVGDGDDGREEGREDLLEGLEPPKEPDHLPRPRRVTTAGAELPLACAPIQTVAIELG